MMKKFPVMLASPNKFIDRINFPAIVQTKMDGMRANIVRENKTIVYSRNGKVMELFDRFRDSIPDNHVLDGEFLVYKDGILLDRKTGNGILHKAVVGTISADEAAMVKMVVWDMIPLDKWKKGLDDTLYSERLEKLKDLNKKLYTIIDTQYVDDMEQVNEIYYQKIKEGEEGIIVKNIDHPWEPKRSKGMIKMKEVLEIDLRIVDYVEGEGKYVGMLGKFVCENASRTINVGVGTGYSDEQRESFSKSDIGNVCTVKYNAIIESKTKTVRSLFLPVFVEMRPDKDEPN